jgi:hypothetical protein
MYSAVVNDYTNKESKEIYATHSKYDCLMHIEDYLYNFLLSKQGIQPEVYYTVDELPKIPKNRYSIVKSNQIQYMFTVYFKRCDLGLLYNSYGFQPIFTIQLIKKLDIYEPMISNFYEEFLEYEKYSKVINQLDRFNEMNTSVEIDNNYM